MAGFFEKVLWTECTGDKFEGCEKKANREHLPPHKNRCECGSNVRQVVKVDAVKAGIAGLLVAALLGGGGWYLRAKAIGAVSGVVGEMPGRGGEQPASGAPISWSVQTERAGAASKLSPARDFEVNGNNFRFRDSLAMGDRMRLEVSYKTDKLYAFHRNGSEAMHLGTESGGRVTLPASDKWFEMDGRQGTEEFILVAAPGALPALDQMTGRPDPVALDREVRNAEASGKTTVVRIQIPQR